MKIFALVGALSLISLSSAGHVIAGPVGEWRIADGSANVSIRPCGSNLCGFVSWAEDGQAVVGKEVIVSMRQNGTLWSGTAINVRDGQKYTARISMPDDQTLKVEGCVVGGMICGGQQWARVH